MIEIRQMTVEDYEAISVHGEQWWKGRIPTELVAKNYMNSGPALSFWHNGTLLMVAGIVSPWPKSGEAWAILSPEASTHAVGINRTVARVLVWLAKGMGLRRLQAHVRSDFRVGIRWVEWLGFVKEGEMKEFGPEGEDFNRYVMFLEVA